MKKNSMFLLGSNGSEQWIGLDDGWGSRVFVWSDGQKLVSGDARWADNEPNNNNYQEHCVLLEGDNIEGLELRRREGFHM